MLDLVEREQHGFDLGVGQQADPTQPTHVGPGAGDVVTPEATVERQAGGVGHQRRVRPTLEPAVPQGTHWPFPDSMPARSRPSRIMPGASVATTSALTGPFTAAQIKAFRTADTQVIVGFDHAEYSHMAVVPEAVRQELAGDFN